MHRTICRVLRGRKWRQNECPAVSGEECQNKWKNQEFVPPKHTWNEAVGWTTGFVIAWQVTHRKARLKLGDDSPSFAKFSTSSSNCPFGLGAVAISQPIISTVNNVVGHKNRRPGFKKTSIDATPFLKEDLSLLDSSNLSKPFAETDCDVVFEEEKPLRLNIYKNGIPLITKALDDEKDLKKEARELDADGIINKFSADLYSALGSFAFLHKTPKENGENCSDIQLKIISDGDNPSKSPPMHAIELLKRGAELGSSRALYNIGVAYDRLKEPKLAEEYYKKAADLGHPLATYNASIFQLKEGHLAEGLNMMRIAAEKGVPEAKKLLRDLGV